MATTDYDKPIRKGARDHARALTRLGLPLVGAQLAQMSIFTVDTLMLGWYDVTALAAVSLAGPLFFLVFILGSGFAWAVLPMVSAAVAEGDQTQVRRTTRMGLWLSLVFAALVLPVFFVAEPILLAVGQERDVAVLAAHYLAIVSAALPAALVIQLLRSFLTALELTRVLVVGTVAWSGLNAILNYALIFGNWGAPELGVTGAAIASVTGNVFFMTVLILYARARCPEYELWKNLHRPDWDALGQVFRLGWPISLTLVSEVGLFAASTLLMGALGEIPLAAHGIALQIASITFMVHLGLSQAITVRAGRAWAQTDKEALRGAASVALAMSLTFAVMTILTFLIVPEFLVGLFIDPTDPDRDAVLAVGVTLLALAALFQLVDAAQVMALGTLRGVQDTFWPMIMATISYWLIGLPAAWILGLYLGYGGAGVWLGLTVGLASAGIMMQWRFWTRFARG